MLKHIELTGFKSFARKSRFKFENNITAIVGPNGSGKSNSSEAFRFVLGEQGSKTMRIKKSPDLIWGGSHKLPRASRAAVKLVLDNSSKQFNVDFDDIILERVVLADGNNEYYINGSKVRLKDIQQLLSQANIGTTGHHIISQGQADRILTATNKERRAMIEDALGLNVLLQKQKETERKLNTTINNLSQIKSQRREIAPQLKYLQRQVDSAQKREELKQQLIQMSGVFATRMYHDINKKITEYKEKLIEPVNKKDALQKQIDVLRVKIDEFKATKNKEATDNSKRELQSLQHELSDIDNEITTTTQKIDAIKGKLELLKQMQQDASKAPESVSVSKVNSMLTEIVEGLEMAEETNDAPTIASIALRVKNIAKDFIKRISENPDNEGKEYESQIKDLTRELDELNSLLGQLNIKRTKLLPKIASLDNVCEGNDESKMVELERDMYKLVAEYNTVKTIVSEYLNHISVLESEYQDVNNLIDSVEATVNTKIDVRNISAVKELNISQRDIEEVRIRVLTLPEVSKDTINEYKEVKQRYEYLSAQIDDISGTINKLEELIQQLKDNIKTRFTNGVTSINKEFNIFFKQLFGGGNAELKLTKSENELGEIEYGLDIKVKLPRKKATTLETLSGGERALTSIALIFAMSQVNPPPFIILDETDAALDEANSRRYALLVKELSKRSQIILITHNRATMSVADTLYGVTMGSDGVSQLLNVHLRDAEQYAK